MKWNAVVPFRGTAGSKSRLIVPGTTSRVEGSLPLAAAFAADLLSALDDARVDRVIIVSAAPDAQLNARLAASAHHYDWILDSGEGLNAAICQGINASRTRNPDHGVIVLPADLPLVRSGDVDEVLRVAAHYAAAYVPDRDGTGTSALILHPGVAKSPSFGPNSASMHRREGFAELRLAHNHPLRWDVDTYEDLVEARELGLSTHTEALLSGIRLPDIRIINQPIG